MRKKSEIKKEAQDIYDKFGLTIPLSVASVARFLNIEVSLLDGKSLFEKAKESNPDRIKGKNPSQILGFYDKSNSKFYINSTDQPITRQKFTIAHEIGHCVLHPTDGSNDFRMVVLSEDIYTFENGNDPIKEKEIEANYFAAYLLMPDKEIIKRLKFIELWRGGELAIRKLAELFGVSSEAMRIRLKTFKTENPDIWLIQGLNEKLF